MLQIIRLRTRGGVLQSPNFEIQSMAASISKYAQEHNHAGATRTEKEDNGKVPESPLIIISISTASGTVSLPS
jgi:hypothetical protein